MEPTADSQSVESKSLPLLSSAPAYDRKRIGGFSDPALRSVDEPALLRVEQRLIKGLRGVGAAILHDVAIPATGTTIDHLCITPTSITAIDVERDSEGDGRAYLIDRVRRESQVVAAALTDALVGIDDVSAAVCRSVRPEPLRPSLAGEIIIGGPRALARIARRGRPGDKIDVQLALAAARNHFGLEHQRALRLSKPDGFLAYL
jgi:hypothetical protein